MASRTIRIEDEAQAGRVLERALEGAYDRDNVELVFENWPVIAIKAKGPGYDSTITPGMAEALVSIQQAMNRSYARYVHSRATARLLTAEEKQAIQFKAKVKRGSSLVEINLDGFAQQLGTALVGKMSSTEIVITLIGLAMVAGATVVARSFIVHKAKEKGADLDFRKSIALSGEETKRLEVVTRALTADRRLAASKEDFDEGRLQVLRSVGDAASLAVNDIEMPNAVARSLGTAGRKRADEIQLNGNFKIFKIDWQHEDVARLSLGGGDRKGEFTATIGTLTMSDEYREMLQDAEWGRKSLYMQINATELRGEITSARIVSVSPSKSARRRLNVADEE